MTHYADFAADQYMRSVLREEFTSAESDNALTALSTLTGLFPGLFPIDRTFARPDYQRGSERALGVRFVVYGPEGIERTVRVPRAALASLEGIVDETLTVVYGLSQAAA
ncbi:hypothetical protein SEA_CECE_177 [Microbacterium phage Cece]|nr:hypothetical protein SEA_CECE_177 [Microbacterium phage Cece]